MPTEVIHVRDMQPGDIYIGRAMPRQKLKASKWMNPYKLHVESERDLVIQKYRLTLEQRPDLLSDIHELRGKRLACWCAPKACHGDILAELADKQ